MRDTIQKYKKSINESSFSDVQIRIIWDFYVTKAMATSASQKRKPSDYGNTRLTISDLMKTAGIRETDSKFLLADTMPKTLKSMDFIVVGDKGVEKEIDIDTPRVAFVTPYTISDDEGPKAKKDCSRVESLFTHIRNSFAHGNTYFFVNGNVLLEDKNERNTTAMILIRQQTLLDWIIQIDKTEKYYMRSEILGTLDE